MNLPTIHPVEQVAFPDPEKFTLKNGISVFGYNGTKNDILRIDLVFHSGRWTEPARLIADSAARLLKSGTASLSSFELSEQIDQYGSTIRTGAGFNTFNVSLYCMNRYLEPSLQLLRTCLCDIVFPENEIALFKQNALSKLRLSREKNDYLADVAFRKAVYGTEHPYGYETTETDIQRISRELLMQFYQSDVHPGLCTVFLAGKFGDVERKLLDTCLGEWTSAHAVPLAPDHSSERISSAQKNIRINKERSVQASIVIGKELFNKHHEDYGAFILLNTIFGGYFGSRLMSNIREEKGLTYGIYSGLSPLKYSGTFSIQTDTNLDQLDLCLREIYSEIERLQNELIPEREIVLARNYLMGKFLARTDGPFNRVEVLKSYFVEGADIHKFEEFEETITRTDAVSLQRLAQQHLSRESLYEVVAG